MEPNGFAVPPPDVAEPPPPAAMAPLQARALIGAQAANESVSTPAAAGFRPVLIVSNTSERVTHGPPKTGRRQPDDLGAGNGRQVRPSHQ